MNCYVGIMSTIRAFSEFLLYFVAARIWYREIEKEAKENNTVYNFLLAAPSIAEDYALNNSQSSLPTINDSEIVENERSRLACSELMPLNVKASSKKNKKSQTYRFKE